MSTAAPAAHGPVLADLLPASRLRDAALVLGGAALTGLAAQLSVPVPGSPVPVTGQTFAALLAGAALGPRRAFAALGLYAAAGAAGLPWFAGATSGFTMPTFGYILGMLLAAPVVGALARRGADRTPARTAAAMVLGSLLIYALGVPYLAVSAHLPAGQALALGLKPYLLGDALKAALAMTALPATWRLVSRG
ncbi:biotin transporter BioY [Streptomyces sp. NBC_01476]|uniref:biotin transporter BioY n=1 Tax=Streptomyces sp. NBC_01476 TaxID=2903881 RepID=UPI002E2F6B14|nr:biotin transporter BioY [Streptomyces sp. NBC_01476]